MFIVVTSPRRSSHSSRRNLRISLFYAPAPRIQWTCMFYRFPASLFLELGYLLLCFQGLIPATTLEKKSSHFFALCGFLACCRSMLLCYSTIEQGRGFYCGGYANEGDRSARVGTPRNSSDVFVNTRWSVVIDLWHAKYTSPTGIHCWRAGPSRFLIEWMETCLGYKKSKKEGTHAHAHGVPALASTVRVEFWWTRCREIFLTANTMSKGRHKLRSSVWKYPTQPEVIGVHIHNFGIFYPHYLANRHYKFGDCIRSHWTNKKEDFLCHNSMFLGRGVTERETVSILALTAGYSEVSLRFARNNGNLSNECRKFRIRVHIHAFIFKLENSFESLL